MSNADHVRAIVDLIRRNGGGTSFVEITRLLESRGFQARGDYAVDLGLNVIAWAGISEEYVRIVSDLASTNQVHMRPTQTLVYMVDGEMLRLPIAKNPPKNGYKDPHWVPVCWQVGPSPYTPLPRSERYPNKENA